LKGKAREVRETFFRRHAAEMYDKITSGCTVRCGSSTSSQGRRSYPGLLPTRRDRRGPG
jgi:hypothetical protein